LTSQGNRSNEPQKRIAISHCLLLVLLLFVPFFPGCDGGTSSFYEGIGRAGITVSHIFELIIPTSDPIIAGVEGLPIRYSTFKDFLQHLPLPQSIESLSPDVALKMLNGLIFAKTEVILARREGLDKQEPWRSELRRSGEITLILAYRKFFIKHHAVPEDAIKQYYTDHASAYSGAGNVPFQQIRDSVLARIESDQINLQVTAALQKSVHVVIYNKALMACIEHSRPPKP
jgi:hypothetical protein